MIPVYICDDEKGIRTLVQKELENAIVAEGYGMRVTLSTPDPVGLLRTVEKNGTRGVYFLDVDLKNKAHDGFSLAAAIRKADPRGFIIFVTTHGERALETFRLRLEAMDYIEKDDTAALPTRLRACLAEVQKRLEGEAGESSGVYTLRVFDEIRNIPLQSILYIETAPHKQHTLVLHGDSLLLEYPGKLAEAEKELGEGFWRTHRSYLVNRGRVRSVLLKESGVELDNGVKIPLSRKAKKEV